MCLASGGWLIGLTLNLTLTSFIVILLILTVERRGKPGGLVFFGLVCFAGFLVQYSI